MKELDNKILIEIYSYLKIEWIYNEKNDMYKCRKKENWRNKEIIE